MRRMALFAVSLGMFLAVGGSSSADFHPACDGILTAYAQVGLAASADGSTLEYSGVVNCPGEAITINSLTLDTVPAGLLPIAATSGSCPAGPAPCTLAGTVPASSVPTGTLGVRMLFSVPGFGNVPRAARWNWSGSGQPVLACTSAGFFPAYVPPCTAAG